MSRKAKRRIYHKVCADCGERTDNGDKFCPPCLHTRVRPEQADHTPIDYLGDHDIRNEHRKGKDKWVAVEWPWEKNLRGSKTVAQARKDWEGRTRTARTRRRR